MMDSAATAPASGFKPPPFLYEIRVKGRLSPNQWTDWFGDLEVTPGDGESLLRGRGRTTLRSTGCWAGCVTWRFRSSQ